MVSFLLLCCLEVLYCSVVRCPIWRSVEPSDGDSRATMTGGVSDGGTPAMDKSSTIAGFCSKARSSVLLINDM